MTAPLKSIEGSGDIAAAMGEIGRRARGRTGSSRWPLRSKKTGPCN